MSGTLGTDWWSLQPLNHTDNAQHIYLFSYLFVHFIHLLSGGRGGTGDILGLFTRFLSRVETQGPSNAQCRRNVNFDMCIRWPLLFYVGGPLFWKQKVAKTWSIGCVSKYVVFIKLLFSSSRLPQKMGFFPENSITGQKCMCLSEKLWKTGFVVETLWH